MFAQEKAFRQQLCIPFDICIKLLIKFIVEIKLLQSHCPLISDQVQMTVLMQVLGCGEAGWLYDGWL